MAATMLQAMLIMTFAAWSYSIAAALHRVRSIILERESHARWLRRDLSAAPGASAQEAV